MSSTAPAVLAKVTAELLPNAPLVFATEATPAARVPPLTVVAPVYVFAPLSVNVPAPTLVRSLPAAPAITELTVRVPVAATSMVASAAPSVTPWFTANVASFVTARVPPLMVTWSAVNPPGSAPRPLEPAIDTVPPLIAVLPW